MVHLVQVDVIGLEPSQAVLTGPPDVVGRETTLVRALAHLVVHLGRQHDPLAPRAALRQPAPDDLLGDALAELPAIHIGGVEEVDPQLQRLIHNRKAVGLAGLRAEVHGA
jgi:hypothetical protein